MTTTAVTLRMSLRELQIVKAALNCYACNIQVKNYAYINLAPTDGEPLEAKRIAQRIIQDIGGERKAR